jgi:hypothetical protein
MASIIKEGLPMIGSLRFFPGLARSALAVLLCAVTATSLSAEGRSWIANSDADATWLIYGTPESDDILLSLTCERGPKTFIVWFSTQPASEQNPKTLPIELVSAGGRVQLTGNGSRSEMDDLFSLEAKTALTPDVEKLLAGGKTLSVHVDGAKTDIPIDETAQKGIDDIVKGCRK